MLGIRRSKILERWRNRLWKQLAPSWTLTSGVKTRLDSFSDWIVFCDLFVDLEYDAAGDTLPVPVIHAFEASEILSDELQLRLATQA